MLAIEFAVMAILFGSLFYAVFRYLCITLRHRVVVGAVLVLAVYFVWTNYLTDEAARRQTNEWLVVGMATAIIVCLNVLIRSMKQDTLYAMVRERQAADLP